MNNLKQVGRNAYLFLFLKILERRLLMYILVKYEILEQLVKFIIDIIRVVADKVDDVELKSMADKVEREANLLLERVRNGKTFNKV